MIRRRPIMPPEVESRVELTRGEEFLAAAPTIDGWLVATSHRVIHVPNDGNVSSRPWTDIESASSQAPTPPPSATLERGPRRKDPEAPHLTIRWVDGDRTTYELQPVRSHVFSDTFREHVKRSIVHVEHVEGSDGAARVAVRRDPDGNFFAQVMADGVDPAAEPLAREVEAALDRAIDATGIDL